MGTGRFVKSGAVFHCSIAFRRLLQYRVSPATAVSRDGTKRSRTVHLWCDCVLFYTVLYCCILVLNADNDEFDRRRGDVSWRC